MSTNKPFLPIGHSDEKSHSTPSESRTSHYSDFTVEEDKSQRMMCPKSNPVKQTQDRLPSTGDLEDELDHFAKLSMSSRPNGKRLARHCSVTHFHTNDNVSGLTNGKQSFASKTQTFVGF